MPVRALLATAVLALMLAGCSQAPASAPTVKPAPVVRPDALAAQYRSEGDALMAQQEWEKAAGKYEAAANAAPDDISIRFALATALSYLEGRHDATVEAFTFVMRRGVSGSAEVQSAREWLANTKALGENDVAATPASEPVAAETSAKGSVFGDIRWQDIEPKSKMVRINISLTGDDNETRDAKFKREFKIGRVFEFKDVPPGAYQLVAEVGGTKMWEMKVSVASGKKTHIDLTEGNAVAPKDFSPPSD
jgi:hypothetical protein